MFQGRNHLFHYLKLLVSLLETLGFTPRNCLFHRLKLFVPHKETLCSLIRNERLIRILIQRISLKCKQLCRQITLLLYQAEELQSSYRKIRTLCQQTRCIYSRTGRYARQ